MAPVSTKNSTAFTLMSNVSWGSLGVSWSTRLGAPWPLHSSSVWTICLQGWWPGFAISIPLWEWQRRSLFQCPSCLHMVRWLAPSFLGLLSLDGGWGPYTGIESLRGRLVQIPMPTSWCERATVNWWAGFQTFLFSDFLYILVIKHLVGNLS